MRYRPRRKALDRAIKRADEIEKTEGVEPAEAMRRAWQVGKVELRRFEAQRSARLAAKRERKRRDKARTGKVHKRALRARKRARRSGR